MDPSFHGGTQQTEGTKIIFISQLFIVKQREKQKETVEDLLVNILPKKVVMRLKDGYVGTFAEDFPNCTVMFADVCDFYDICNSLSPAELVDTLDAIFSGYIISVCLGKVLIRTQF